MQFLGSYNPGPFFKFNNGVALRINPINLQMQGHKGIDWSALIGTPIPAAAYGIVVDSGVQIAPDKTGWGYYIVLQHTRQDGTTFQTLYAHLNAPSGLANGTVVNAGQTVGFVGQSGGATGPHLHMEVIVNGNARPQTMGGVMGTRLDATQFANWGDIPHMIGTDASGNKIIEQITSSGGVSTVAITALSPSGVPTTLFTGKGMSIPGQASSPDAVYTMVISGSGFMLIYANGAIFNDTGTSQQWAVPDANGDGGATVYSRHVYAGTVYGDWTTQQSTALGLLTSTNFVTGATLKSLIISKGTGATNSLISGAGITTTPPKNLTAAQAMSLYQATNIPVVFTQHSVDVANGNTSAITIYTSGTSTVDQIIQLTLNGSAANKYVCTGANEIAFDSSGNATVIIPAGQDSVTVTLVDGANQNTADQFSLTASIVDPSAPAGSTPVTSNTFDVTFDSPNPNASIISAGADRTITGDFKPLEKTSELSASAKIDPTWIVLSKTVGQTTTDAQGNTVVVTYVYKYNQVDDLGNVIPDTGQPDPNHNDMLPVCCPNRMCRRSMVCLGGEDDCRLLPFAVQFISQPSAFYYT